MLFQPDSVSELFETEISRNVKHEVLEFLGIGKASISPVPVTQKEYVFGAPDLAERLECVRIPPLSFVRSCRCHDKAAEYARTQMLREVRTR